MSSLLMVVSFVVILLGAKLFTNAVEWAGLRLGMVEGAVGSLLAAVGTAMPETMIAVIALFAATSDSKEVAIGAIVGAPFMLATVAMVVVGVSAAAYSRRRPQGSKLVVLEQIGRRDLNFFVFAFSAAFLVTLVPTEMIRFSLAAILIFAYLAYFWRTLREEGAITGEVDPLTFARRASRPALGLILLQLIIALGLIVGGATVFIDALIEIAESLGASPLVLSLILAPLATELPEKANSVFWVREGKDTLALGNITGAMVFQSTLPVSLGLIFTDWKLDGVAQVSILLGVAGALVVGAFLRLRGAISLPAIAAAAALYGLFIAYVVVYA